MEIEEIAQRVVRHRFDAGLTTYILPLPGFVRKYASLTAGFGSVDVHLRDQSGKGVEVPAGVAHFLEHKMFENAEAPVLDQFARLGASANAYTSYEVTSYLFSCTDFFWEALDLLLRFVQGAHFTPEGVEKEKPIIEQEIRMGLDSPHRVLVSNLRQLLFWQHPVREDVAGTVESVRSITFDQLELCYRTFYHPSNLVLYVAGDLEPRAVLDRVEADLACRRPGPPPAFRRRQVEEPGTVVEPGGQREARLAVAVPLVAVGYKDPFRGEGEANLRRRVAGEMALEMVIGRGSDLYHRLYREGLIDDTFAGSHASGQDWAYTVLMGRTPHPEQLATRLPEELRRARDAWSISDLERCRRASLGQFVSLFDSVEAPSYMVNELHFFGLGLSDYVRVLRDLSAEEVAGFLGEALADERCGRSLVLPTQMGSRRA